MADIGVALIGAGSIADYHLGGMRGVAGARVRVVASRTLARARAVAAGHGVPEASDDVAAVLARPDVDAALITTPDDTHEALTLAALAAGKAVMVQKPMAVTSAACRRMIEAAARAGLDLQVSWMHRHFPEVAAARARLAAGAIGAVATARMRNATPGPDWSDWFFKRENVSGGVVRQLGVHGIDLVGHLFGPIAAVSARAMILRPTRRLADGRVTPVENEDTAFALYEIEGGPLVHHEMSMIESVGTDRFRLEIHGERGALWLRTERGALAEGRPGGAWSAPDLPGEPLGLRHHQAWIDGLLGRAPRQDTAMAGLRGLLVAEAIAASAAADGRRVRVAAV